MRTAYDDPCKEETLVPRDDMVSVGESSNGSCFQKVLPCKKCDMRYFYELKNRLCQFVFNNVQCKQTATILANRTSPMQNQTCYIELSR